MKKTGSEIVSLNKEMWNFDVLDIEADELERRLELAIATIVPALQDCGSFCDKNTCTTNCGIVYKKLGG